MVRIPEILTWEWERSWKVEVPTAPTFILQCPADAKGLLRDARPGWQAPKTAAGIRTGVKCRPTGAAPSASEGIM